MLKLNIFCWNCLVQLVNTIEKLHDVGKTLENNMLETVDEGFWKEYRRIHRDISDPGLVNTVWSSTKKYFMDKIRHFETIIAESYKQKKLSFSAADVAAVFATLESKYESKARKDRQQFHVSSGAPQSSSVSLDRATRSSADSDDDKTDMSELDSS